MHGAGRVNKTCQIMRCQNFLRVISGVLFPVAGNFECYSLLEW